MPTPIMVLLETPPVEPSMTFPLLLSELAVADGEMFFAWFPNVAVATTEFSTV